MPKLSEKKTAIVFENAQPKSRDYSISDGRGLYMLVPSKGMKRWYFRYSYGGSQKKIAIKGGFPSVSLSKAREIAGKYSAMLLDGIDPKARSERENQEAIRIEREAMLEAEKMEFTFEKVAKRWLSNQTRLDLRHKGYIQRRLEMNVYPYIGNKHIDSIKPMELLDCLKRIEKRGSIETAHRTLGVCNRVFRFANDLEISDRNPASNLKKHLTLPTSRNLAAIIDPAKVGQLLLAVDGYQGTAATRAALQLGILTFVRPGNLQAAEWSHFDLKNEEWRIPGRLMKVKTADDFIVPLAPQAVKILKELQPLTGAGRFVFPKANSTSRPMCNNTLNAAYRRMGYTKLEMTAHGVRAMARTLCDERLGINPDAIEAQLAHSKKGPLGSSYDRTTYLDQRKVLMTRYANYLDELREQARRPAEASPI